MNRFVYILILFIVSCSSTDEAEKASVMEIRELGQLATVEYTIGKLIQLDQTDVEWYKWGDRKLLIKTRATVKAGIDLKKIKEDDIVVKGNTIEITLPPAEYISLNMDPNDTKTEVESISGFRDNFTQKEKNAFLKQGEEAIRKDLGETKILQDAAANAEDIIRDFYKELCFEKIIIHSSIED